ncbi:protein IQ-DOMAIN 22 [Arachis hypogaea]|uniref:protein IQ-DOMAIN 22 n=1 Tax=Arachis hypogaea TaxID=3818 RepID=UPI000DEC0C3D|nr:protein IQ-DOMAIN 14 isoform X1 [Arachis hypogaea]
MGKATKWFRGLFGLRRSSDSAPPPSTAAPKPHKDKRRWSFVNSYRENKNLHQHRHQVRLHASSAHDPAIEVVAAAGLKSSGSGSGSGGRSAVSREEWAAVKIQAAFRGCLARRALRALKGLVKLQALVRGHIERKRTAQWLQRMQTLLRAQARARACRAQILQAPHFHVPATPEKFETPVRSSSMEYNHSPSVLKRNGSRSHVTIGNREIERSWTQRRSWTRTCSMDDERSAGIFEIDSGKAHKNSKRGNLFDSTSQPLVSDHYRQSFATTRDSTSHQSGHSPYSCEVEENSVCDAVNFTYTPTKSDGSNRSYLSSGCCEYYLSYMAYTESSKAKVRSLSAPKQRLQYERCGSFNRFSQTQRVSSTMRASFTSKAYPGSGHLDNLGLPLGYRY